MGSGKPKSNGSEPFGTLVKIIAFLNRFLYKNSVKLIKIPVGSYYQFSSMIIGNVQKKLSHLVLTI